MRVAHAKYLFVLILLIPTALGFWPFQEPQPPFIIRLPANLIYGNLYDYNEMSFPTVDLTDANIHVPISMTLQSVNNVTFDGNLTIIVPGLYKLQGGVSLSGGANSEYGLVITKNDVGLDNGCHSHRKVGTGGDIGYMSTGPCVYFLAAGDTIALEIEDEATPVSDPSIHDARLYIELIHN